MKAYNINFYVDKINENDVFRGSRMDRNDKFGLSREDVRSLDNNKYIVFVLIFNVRHRWVPKRLKLALRTMLSL